MPIYFRCKDIDCKILQRGITREQENEEIFDEDFIIILQKCFPAFSLIFYLLHECLNFSYKDSEIPQISMEMECCVLFFFSEKSLRIDAKL